ncbi:hypothetical protein [Candidatus Odyssella thessalonicensis]|uniref:hypothetical protein n=1 Tax=Candidatus Odyssella thessalonicensis TaxID=84647 RepID=UPI000225C093|nr:hypothetical protein [Candidatus Odyssella thessalonicensis]
MNRILLNTAVFILLSCLTLSIGQTNEREDDENSTVSLSEIAEALPLSEEEQDLEAKEYFDFGLPENFIKRDSLKNICLKLITKKVEFDRLAEWLLERLPEELCESVFQGMPARRVLEFWRYINQLQDDEDKKRLINKMRPGLDSKYLYGDELQGEEFTVEEIFDGPFRRLRIKVVTAYNYLHLLQNNTHLTELHLHNTGYDLSPELTDEIFQEIIIDLAKNLTLQRIHWAGFFNPATFVAVAPMLASFPPGRQVFFHSEVLRLIEIVLKSPLEEELRLRVLELLRVTNNWGLGLSKIKSLGLDLQHLLDLNFNHFIIDDVLDNHHLSVLSSHHNLRGLILRTRSSDALNSNLQNLIEICEVNKNIEVFAFNPFMDASQRNSIIAIVKNLSANPNFKKLQLSSSALPYMLTLRDLFNEEHHSNIRADLMQQLQRLYFDTSEWEPDGYTLVKVLDLHPQKLFLSNPLNAQEILALQDRIHLQELEFNNPLTDNDTLQRVAQVIRSLPYLASLQLKLAACEYDSKIFEHFVATVCSHINLKKLKVTCYGTARRYKHILDQAIKVKLLAEGIEA